jgi:hypothetical protein
MNILYYCSETHARYDRPNQLYVPSNGLMLIICCVVLSITCSSSKDMLRIHDIEYTGISFTKSLLELMFLAIQQYINKIKKGTHKINVGQ